MEFSMQILYIFSFKQTKHKAISLTFTMCTYWTYYFTVQVMDNLFTPRPSLLRSDDCCVCSILSMYCQKGKTL